jgi:hypothetical protein
VTYHLPCERHENRAPRSTTPTTPAARFIVRCEDGRIRHLHDTTVPHGSFPDRLEAMIWADHGHICTARHTFERIVPIGSRGCVVLPGLDGPTYDDCTCTSCRVIQAAAEAEAMGLFEEGE